YFSRATQLHAAGRLPEAEQAYRQILAAAPTHADSRHMLGVLALQAGHPEGALAEIDQAISLRPAAAMFHVNRANALLATNRPDDAIAASRQALHYKRNAAEAMQTLGRALSDLGRADEAVTAYQGGLQMNPLLRDLHNDLGLALHDASRPEEAAGAFAEALRRTPGDPLTMGNLAGALKDIGRLTDAEQTYRDILRADPDNATAHFNLGVLLLLAGRFAEGWREWEWRFRADPAITRSFPPPAWQGEPLAGRTLLIYGEQGLGDMIQFSRFLPLVADLAGHGGKVVLEIHRPLARLLAQLPGPASVTPIGEPLPRFDLHCPLMSLPRLLGIDREADIPATVPYLRADSALVAPWQEKLLPFKGLRVGLVWSGGPDRVRLDRRRSIPVELLAGLAAVPGITLVSLQKGAAASHWPGTALDGAMHDWTDMLGDFADTAALVECLDLVISVDTAVVHLAGALGKPVWLLNRADTCWRWMLGRDDSPWYPTLRQFRQERAGAWEPVIARMTEALASFASTVPPDRRTEPRAG